MGLELHYHVGSSNQPPREGIDLAKYAVDAGFEGVWMGDHFYPFLDSKPNCNHIIPWFGSVMAEIPDVPVGTSVTCPLFRYEPPVLAQMLATLDNMYPGRLQFGVGVGEAVNEWPFIDGDWPDWGTRASMLVEAIEIIRQMWRHDGFTSYAGEYFEYDLLKLYTRPKAPLPIHWAAWGPTSAKYAGYAAGNMLTLAPASEIETVLNSRFETGLADSGRDKESAEVTATLSFNLGDPEAIVEGIRDAGEYVPVRDVIGEPDPRVILDRGQSELDKMSDDEIRDQFNVVDDLELVVEQLETYEQAGVDRVNISSGIGDARGDIDALAEGVLPRF
jgi:coenzyme F420-dependent glucose-6-phosphate dehydrogenase